MKFISAYIQEQRRYTKQELQKIFDFTSWETEGFFRLLNSYGILKKVRDSSYPLDLAQLAEADFESIEMGEDSGSGLYIFNYVGVLLVGNRVIQCFPKYLGNVAQPIQEMKQILKVLQMYGAKKQTTGLSYGGEQSGLFNPLAAMLYILSDYHENGLYENFQELVEENGEGEILWERTIFQGFPIMRDNKPYYVDYYSRCTAQDEQDYFSRLHSCIVTDCSHQLEAAGLLSLFELAGAEPSQERLSEFGEPDSILRRLEGELNIQYNSRKQLVLRTLYAYIAHQSGSSSMEGLSMYGTTSFQLVWQEVCSCVFRNRLHTPLGQLPIVLAPGYDKQVNLISLIPSPKWFGYTPQGNRFHKQASETLVPDIVCVTPDSFILLDAKYYCPQLAPDQPLRGQPGVGDITKQYLYQLAFKQFICDHQIPNVKNCFILPVAGEQVVNLGEVSMEILDAIPLERIQLRQVPASLLYDHYLNHSTLEVSCLSL